MVDAAKPSKSEARPCPPLDLEVQSFETAFLAAETSDACSVRLTLAQKLAIAFLSPRSVSVLVPTPESGPNKFLWFNYRPEFVGLTD